MSVFHYALRAHGFLMLGSAETIGASADLFALVNKKHRIYKKKIVDTPPIQFPVQHPLPRQHERSGQVEPPAAANIQQEANRLVMEHYAPPGVIVDDELQIVQFRGQTGRFLEPSPGDASLNLLKMAREGLLYGLRTALHAARKTGSAVRKTGLRVKHNGSFLEVNLAVLSLPKAGGVQHFLVLFEEPPRSAPALEETAKPKKRAPAKAVRNSERAELERLQQELSASRDYLQSMIQDLEAANEELQSANEEILSSNEELQSTNEELDTAKEELQSTNEELNTLNEELQNRNEELSRLNSDLINLLSSIQIAVVIVSRDLRIRRFTPMAERVLNLIPGDVGRPIGQIKPNFEYPDLQQRIGEVIDHISLHQQEVRDPKGKRYSLTIRPYKDVDNRIDGAVLSLFEIDDGRHQLPQLEEALELAAAVLEELDQPAVLLDHHLRVEQANEAFCRRFGVTLASYKGNKLSQLADGRWSQPQIEKQLESVLHSSQRSANLVLKSTAEEEPLLVSARRISGGTGGRARVLLTIRKDAEKSSPKH
jgi:two-component system CheB/CheR fusion protein